MAVLQQYLLLASRQHRLNLRLPIFRTFSSSTQRQDTYGFIGLGAMGYPMATNLSKKLSQKDKVLVYDVNSLAVKRFIQEASTSETGSHVEAASSAREIAEEASTIITVLPEPHHVKSVFDSILSSTLPSSSNRNRLYIDCSTIDPKTSTSIASQITTTCPGDLFVDAPMSGGVVGATAGTLTFMLGCPLSAQPRISSILSLMGKRTIRLGEQGTGLVGKLANNYLLSISNIATAEAMNLGISLGLDGIKLAELINSSSGRCWSSEVNNPVPGVSSGAPASRGYEGGFGVGLMRKDLRLAMEAAREGGVRLELADRARDVYKDVEGSEGGKDFSVVYKWLGEKNRDSVKE